MPVSSQAPSVTIVFGPPGSGKSTYVREHLQEGDIFWDLDEIKGAITGRAGHDVGHEVVPFALAMRRAFYLKAMDAKGLNIRAIWIIESRPPQSMAPEIEQLRASVVSLNTPKEVCMERIKDRGPEWTKIVEEWFAHNART